MTPDELLARLAASRIAFWISVGGTIACLASWGTWLQLPCVVIAVFGLFLQWRAWVR